MLNTHALTLTFSMISTVKDVLRIVYANNKTLVTGVFPGTPNFEGAVYNARKLVVFMESVLTAAQVLMERS